MIRVFLAESRKLRRPTLVLSTILAVVGLEALFTSLLYLLINSRDGNSRRGETISASTLSLPNGLVAAFSSTATLLGVVALCIFAAQTAQEYSLGTLRNLLVRQPSRMKILGGKYLSMAFFALIMDLLALIVSASISFGLAGHAHVITKLWTSHAGLHILAQSFGNVFLATLGYGTLGMILGLLLRSPISSVALGSIWVILIESLLTLVVKGIDRWLPGQLIGTVGGGGMPELSYQRGLLVGGIYLLVGGAVVAFLFKRRDVSN
ncbi:MAG: ABC transporter permease [Actinomycetes bacterium]|jgi:ABC-2 type transport system permease protein